MSNSSVRGEDGVAIMVDLHDVPLTKTQCRGMVVGLCHMFEVPSFDIKYPARRVRRRLGRMVVLPRGVMILYRITAGVVIHEFAHWLEFCRWGSLSGHSGRYKDCLLDVRDAAIGLGYVQGRELDSL